MKFIDGGVTAAKGFKANGIHCGIRKNKSKKDLAMYVCEKMCTAAAVHTQNLVKGAPNTVTAQNLENGFARAMICNSGIANTCAADGIEKAKAMCKIAADALNIFADDVVVASTGVIGPSIDLTPIQNGIDELVSGLSEDGGKNAAEAIMTTDTVSKQVAVEFELGGKVCKIGGMAKGSGMIMPNMATMLCFITTDAAISSAMLKTALKDVVDDTFNMVSVDGDTSTNDMVSVLASGLAGNDEICELGDDYNTFKAALFEVLRYLSRQIAKDGEGATKLIECNVCGAKDVKNAKIIAKSVINSSLLKAAMFGADANWGRVLCAIGYSGAQVDVKGVKVVFRSAKGEITVCENGAGIPVDEDFAKVVLLEDEIKINISLIDGEATATAWGCDLTYDYVKINGDYRS
ncbi:MAG: bifunctional ornithine acetyltransferase/N-acetylglutamate synthase [Clostridia bacterium]|nr:bifunctional ornithine acetyltransferase/N-acetylglutamate synthase [Clostridia bacterium]